MIKRVTLFISMLLLLLLSFSLTASAISDKQNIHDKAGILTDNDEAEINAAIEEFEKNCNVDFVLVTHISSYLDPLEYGSRNFIVLEIEYEYGEYYYELYTYGDAYTKIEDSEADRILDNNAVYKNIKGEKFKDGILAFIACTQKAYSGNYQEPFWQTLLIAFSIALGVSLAICGAVIYSYKRKLKSASYPLDRYARLDLKKSDDIFLGSRVSRVRINTSSSRGGGGRSGGGGGGGSRGRR